MSNVKPLLDSLLWDIYGKQQKQQHQYAGQQQQPNPPLYNKEDFLFINKHNEQWSLSDLKELNVCELIDFCAILKVEMRLMAFILERVLIHRDRHQRYQNVLCDFVDAILHAIYDDAHPKMHFSLSPPPPKYVFSQNVTTKSTNSQKQKTAHLSGNRKNNNFINMSSTKSRQNDNAVNRDHEGNDEEISDYIQWLHAMKLVARLPGGVPSEFRRKLWLSLADKYLKSKNVNWSVEEEKCFCEKWREDDEELGVQIVKDLHRTGSTLCTGPTGDINQAKLKRILLGYARYNPEVGYCQGFNMLGALILQVMDKQESEAIKVMIYLVEGVLPHGYFCGSMGGLQADMAVFRELMQTKLPRLAKHLQKLQGPNESAFEPPLTNVFTMQWFLTMFCTCLPMTCVLRVWDLVLIEGSDVLLRTALVLWGLLEERVLNARSADDFYGKMGSFSSELLNGHLIDSNSLIAKIVQLGPISDIQKLRERHLYNIAPLKNKSGIQLYYDGEDPEVDVESQLAVATVWGLPWGRRSSITITTSTNKQINENKDRLALDISLLKKQYDRLRERQKQAHVILTNACSTAYQSTTPSLPNNPAPVNQLLLGCSAIVTNKGRRVGPSLGSIPPARKPSLPTVLPTRQIKSSQNQLTRRETLHGYDSSVDQPSRGSLTWKEIKAERAALLSSGSVDNFQSQKIRTRGSGKSDSSSYSDESEDGSSTDTSLCDEDDLGNKSNSKYLKIKSRRKLKSLTSKSQKLVQINENYSQDSKRPKSWAPSSSEIPFVLMTTDSPIQSGDEKFDENIDCHEYKELEKYREDSSTESDRFQAYQTDMLISHTNQKFKSLYLKRDQLSLAFDESTSLTKNMIRPPVLGHSTDSENNETKSFDVSDEGVTNEYFERVNIVDRSVKLELPYSLQDERSISDAYTYKEDHLISSPSFRPKRVEHKTDYELEKTSSHTEHEEKIDNLDLLDDYSEKSSKECNEEVKLESKIILIDQFVSSDICTEANATDPDHDISKENTTAKRTLKDKRRDPRRLTLARSFTLYAEDHQQGGQTNNWDLSSRETHVNGGKIRHNSDTPKFDQREEFKIENNENISNSHVIQEPLIESKETGHFSVEAQREGNKFISLSNNVDRSYRSLSTSPQNENINLKEINSNNQNIQNRKDETGNKKSTSSEEVKEEGISKSLTNNDIKNESTKAEVKILKKIPSTAELEVRFNAMERQKHTLKRSFSESKKEPPDDIITEVKQASESIIETQLPTKIDEQLEKENHQKSKDIEDREITSKKSPPTTEELERRFQTLEKQLSVTNSKNESNGFSEQNGKNEIKKHQEENTGDSPESRRRKDYLKEEEMKEEDIEKSLKQKEESNSEEKSPLNVSDEVAKNQSKKIFEDKCVLINKTKAMNDEVPNKTDMKAKVETHVKEGAQQKNEETDKISENPKNIERLKETEKQEFHEKCQSVNLQLATQPKKSETNKTNDLPPIKDGIVEESSSFKRRFSEPPTTEELEKRYESLKRRMSSRIIKEPKVYEESINITENIEATSQTKRDEASFKNKKETGESTTRSPNNQTTPIKILKVPEEESKNESINNGSKLPKPLITEAQPHKQINPPKLTEHHRRKVVTPAENFVIPKAPTPPQHMSSDNANIYDLLQSTHGALIEELQSKIKTQENGKNIKPSTINPKRTTSAQRSPSKNDETSETHAITAFYRSEKYEPWSVNNQKMVRRFSDLPSRADLENRLQFLEQQLGKNLCKQKFASDSGVPSKSKRLEEIPTTSKGQRYAGHVNLEMRVQALEKQLSDNSLKVLEAISATTIKAEGLPTDNLVIPRRLSTDTIDITGKELVKYTHTGNVNELEVHHPINISINIKMTLRKEESEEKPTESNIQALPSTEELDKRLQTLEQHIKESNRHKSKDEEIIIESSSIKEKQLSECTNPNTTEDSEKIIEKSTMDINESVEAEQLKTDAGQLNINITQSTKDNEQMKKDADQPNKGIDQLIKNAEKLNKDAEQCNEKSNTKVKDVDTELSAKATHEKGAKAIERKIPDKEETEEETENIKVIENAKQLSKKTDKLNKDTQQRNEESNNKIKSIATDLSSKAAEEKDAIGEKKVTELQRTEEAVEGIKVIENTCVETTVDRQSGDSSKKTLVLLLDNQPKAVKVRRLTRANTEELEGLFQALEKQLSERNLIKSADGTLKHAEDVAQTQHNDENKVTSETEAICKLSQEISEFTKAADQKPNIEKAKPVEDEPYDWGNNPVKHHLKRKTVHLPSTKELEARFRSLERQIKLLEDVEKIDVEQRLKEIERKIKLQYSLSHEKDINRFLELCEGKDLDEEETKCTAQPKSSQTSPCHKCSQDKKTQTPTRSIIKEISDNNIPSTDDLEYRYRALELKNTKKSKETATSKLQKQPIHPLEMLLEPSLDDSAIPTMGELEHRMRMLEHKKKSTSPTPSRSKSRSPIGRATHYSVEGHSPPTTEELEARLKALEEKHSFDFKMQKNFREFNQKLKGIVSPTYEEPKKELIKSLERSPKHLTYSSFPTEYESRRTNDCRSTSPKVIRFKDEEEPEFKSTRLGRERTVSPTTNVLQTITENSLTLHRILKKTLADGNTTTTASLESLNSIAPMGRFMRETSPLRRTGTHTGVPLRTGENINDRLNSIKNSIKSIDTLCEEKPYCKEKCQRYIDSLFQDSVYMAYKKSSLEELATARGRSRSISKERHPAIRVSDLTATGSFTSIPHSSIYSPQYRSTRDLRRDLSPRRRYSEEREECESRVRRNYTLPIYFKENSSILSNTNDSLTKFYQVDRHLNTNNVDVHEDDRLNKLSANPSPLRYSYGGTQLTTLTTIPKDYTSPITTTTTNNANYFSNTEQSMRSSSPQLRAMDSSIAFLPRPTSPNTLYQDMSITRSNTPVYSPSKLEIRHTTVTSTFYDRLLTEKHLEKTLSRPSSKSPLVSPIQAPQSSLGNVTNLTSYHQQSYLNTSPSQISSLPNTDAMYVHTTDINKFFINTIAPSSEPLRPSSALTTQLPNLSN